MPQRERGQARDRTFDQGALVFASVSRCLVTLELNTYAGQYYLCHVHNDSNSHCTCDT